MPFTQQAELFRLVNSMKPLHSNELIYCPAFLTKSVLQYIFERTCGAIKNHLEKPLRNNLKQKSIRFIHQVLNLTFWKAGNGERAHVTGAINVRKDQIIKGANALHETLRTMTTHISTPTGEDMVKLLGWEDDCDNLEIVGRMLSSVLNHNGLRKPLTGPDTQDLITFFFTKYMDGVFTTSFVNEHRSTLCEMIRQFVKRKRDDNLTVKTTDQKQITRRQQTLETLLNETGLDLGVKGKPLSRQAKLDARMLSTGFCQCGAVLTEENLAMDHVDPKSKSSITKAQVLCRVCNGQKSNISRENAMMLASRFEEIEAVEASMGNIEFGE